MFMTGLRNTFGDFVAHIKMATHDMDTELSACDAFFLGPCPTEAHRSVHFFASRQASERNHGDVGLERISTFPALVGLSVEVADSFWSSLIVSVWSCVSWLSFLSVMPSSDLWQSSVVDTEVSSMFDGAQ